MCTFCHRSETFCGKSLNFYTQHFSNTGKYVLVLDFHFCSLLLLSAKIVENTILLQICKSLQIKTISPNCACKCASAIKDSQLCRATDPLTGLVAYNFLTLISFFKFIFFATVYVKFEALCSTCYQAKWVVLIGFSTNLPLNLLLWFWLFCIT